MIVGFGLDRAHFVGMNGSTTQSFQFAATVSAAVALVTAAVALILRREIRSTSTAAESQPEPQALSRGRGLSGPRPARRSAP